MKEARKRLYTQIHNNCLLRDVNLPAKGGGTYTWMFYMRRRLFTPSFLSDLGEVFVGLMSEAIPDMNFQIAGMETGSTPMVVGLPLAAYHMGLDLNAFSVRKERKEYGLKNLVEGVPNNRPVVIVDDIYNSGGTMRRCLDIVRAEGLPFSGVVFSIIKRTPVNEIMGEGTKYVSVFNLADFGL